MAIPTAIETGPGRQYSGPMEMSASEALYGFCAWLLSRKEKTTMSSRDDVAPVLELMVQFCEANGLDFTRDGWSNSLNYPTTLD